MGEKRIGADGFADALVAPGAGANKRLGRIDAAITWDRFETLLKPLRSRMGRKGYPALAMFKALLLQKWYGLSGPGLEQALGDRMSFRRFCGFSLEDDTPDKTTFARFHASLAKMKLEKKLFREVERQLDQQGLALKPGKLIDARLVPRPPAKESKAAKT